MDPHDTVHDRGLVCIRDAIVRKVRARATTLGR
jgi:hypothetical protein